MSIMIMCIQKLVKFCPFIFKIYKEQKPNSDINQGPLLCCKFAGKKMTLYNPNIDLVNDNVYTKFGLNLSISYQKRNSDLTQVANLLKMMLYNRNVVLVNDNMHIKFD